MTGQENMPMAEVFLRSQSRFKVHMAMSVRFLIDPMLKGASGNHTVRSTGRKGVVKILV